ncbi:ATP-dependent metallopeptidase FtsH/Yme1/Tma family protein, partial [Enterocloster citroniae]|nr:ATP-dependent metallopeptidase FtsH/Yme1/Tma family protein [Enterocloster citroniae]
MDNNNKQDPNTKSNWQTITMLLIAALLTFGLVSWMNSYLNSKRRQELSYNEFVTMVETGDVESIKIGNSEITVIPKSGNTKYS